VDLGGASNVSNENRYRQLVELLAERPAGRLLDIPAGAGPLRQEARRLGYSVVAVDLFPDDGFVGVQADACETFPFADDSFDVVVSMEGIEHFENQTAFLRECARVLRPCGWLLLTTPNILHLNARLAGFLTGQRLLKQGFVNEVATLRGRVGNRIYHGHAFLIDVFRLRYLLRVVGMQLKEVRASRFSPSSLLLAPLVPLIRLATWYSLRSGRHRLQRHRRAVPPADVERQLSELSRSPAVLFGKGLIVVAEKEAAPR
jgi:SAM-dependent methyltransferase